MTDEFVEPGGGEEPILPDEGEPEPEPEPEGDPEPQGDPEEETYRQRYENLERLKGRMSDEIHELREFRKSVEPILEGLKNGQQQKPPEVDPDEQAAANVLYQQFQNQGYADADAASMAWAMVGVVSNMADRKAEKKIAALQPSIDRASSGVIAEDVSGILEAAGIDGITWEDIKGEFKGVTVQQWQTADPDVIKTTVVKIAKAARSDKIDAGTFTPKARAKPKPGNNPDVDGARIGNGAGDTSRYTALADQMNQELGVEGLTSEQLREAEARWRAKGGK